MRLHQITDLHIPEANAGNEFENLRSDILRLLAFVQSDESDLLIITGDLTMQDDSRLACEWLKSVLPRDLTTIIIPGNHDEPATLWDVFGKEMCVNPEFCFTQRSDNQKLLFVNSHTDCLPRQQIEFIRVEAQREDCMLFMHHPPELIGNGFMTLNQPLINHHQVSAVIRASTVSDVFCGHYHNSADMDCDGYRLHLTPSPAFQISLQSVEFKMEEFSPSVRIIEQDAGGMNTWLHFLAKQ